MRSFVKHPGIVHYAKELEFTPQSHQAERFYDIDGNFYGVVWIGNNYWHWQNLKTTRFNDGELIPQVTVDVQWFWSLITGAYCWYENNENQNKDTYGALYNWYAVSSRKLCPQGWKVPTDEDWDRLANSLSGNAVAGGKMKSSGTIENGSGLWAEPNVGANNLSRFSAVPAGGRWALGAYLDKGHKAIFWTSTFTQVSSVWIRSLDYRKQTLDKDFCDYNKRYGFSVRCVKIKN